MPSFLPHCLMSFAPQSTISTSKNIHVFAAVCEYKDQIGIATCDTSFCEVQMSEFADGKTYDLLLTKLLLLDPHVILFPDTQLNNHLMNTLHDNTPAQLIPVDKKHFNHQIGMNTIDSFALKSDISRIKTIMSNQFSSLSCVGALFKYLNSSNEMFSLHSLNFTICAAANTMLIDHTTAKHLELVFNEMGNRNCGSLFNSLNFCCTKMGMRKLRTTILQPSTDEALIEQRQLYISELLQNGHALSNIKEYLTNLGDIDQLILFLVKTQQTKGKSKLNQTINSCIEFKKLCHSLIGLYKLSNSTISVLEPLYTLVTEHEINEIYSQLDLIISDEIVFEKSNIGLQNQRIFAIKTDIDGMLDVARQMYKESVNDVYELSALYAEEFGMAFQIILQGKLGYRLSIAVDLQDKLNEEFVERKRRGKKMTMTTLDLMKLNERIVENVHEIGLTSERVLEELIEFLREHVDVLYRISSGIAHLDFIYSLAKYSSAQSTVKPSISEILAIKQAHHPIRLSLKADSVPNDCYASKESRIQVISGSNMSGKSTYTKQTALLIILSQIGCFVPCEVMYFPIFDAILTRIGNDDDLKTNSGSFVKEMRALSYIFDKVTSKSFVIIDELGRGTCHMDAIAISLATIERLFMSEAIVFMITHIEDLVEPLEQYPGILQVHFEVEMKFGMLSYNYEIKEGASRSKFYGIELARESGLPNELIKDARDIAQSLYSEEQQLIHIDGQVNISKIKQTFYELVRNTCNNRNEMTLKMLKEYRDQYLMALSEL